MKENIKPSVCDNKSQPDITTYAINKTKAESNAITNKTAGNKPSNGDTQNNDYDAPPFGKIKKLLNNLDIKLDEKVAFEDNVVSLIDNLIDYIRQSNETLKSLSDAAEKDSRIVRFIELIVEGYTTEEALIKAEIVVSNADDDGVITAEEFRDYKNSKRNIDILQKTREQNRYKNIETAKHFCEKNCNEHKELENFTNFINSTIESIINNNVNEETLTKLWRAYKFDDFAKQIREQGIVEGRNMQIDAIRDEMNSTSVVANSNINNNSKTRYPEERKMGYIERIILKKL